MTQLLIFGAGGHAREAAQIVADINVAAPGTWQLLGFVAEPDAASANPQRLPAPFLGHAIQVFEDHPGAQCLIAVGNSQARRRIAAQLHAQNPGLRFATLVHPRAWFAHGVQLGPGSVVFAGVHINVDVCIGAHVSINLACTISHDCKLGDFVSLSPGVHLPGGVVLGEAVDVGTGTSFRPRVCVAHDVVIGAGAAVVQDVTTAGTVAVGVPARRQPG
jgi:sugar O-acyltransferase (sialic acid O-acetyltransferase NeuD family)